MMRAASLLLAMVIVLPHAGAQISMGRLFSTPAERATMEASRGASATLAPNSQGQQPAPGTPGGPATPPGMPAPDATGAAPVASAAPLSALTMNGVLRSSGNRTTVWLNDQPQPGMRQQLQQRADSALLTVTLPSGKKIVLKPGQRFDLNEGRIKDVNEP
ncbi:hypothetical protein SAMN05192549_11084 [Duganella sacchari]|uniref:Uncharacterized protein n=1 Tax=Duganella sacchari TaxID=551987 RepID=A0A1M7R3Z2_9BURK|nr:hypothetical protein [Duganella sacchari]SHN39869.1 hypothetical protein SAMN05192549_11084 [Duganella sacchari]